MRGSKEWGSLFDDPEDFVEKDEEEENDSTAIEGEDEATCSSASE